MCAISALTKLVNELFGDISGKVHIQGSILNELLTLVPSAEALRCDADSMIDSPLTFLNSPSATQSHHLSGTMFDDSNISAVLEPECSEPPQADPQDCSAENIEFEQTCELLGTMQEPASLSQNNSEADQSLHHSTPDYEETPQADHDETPKDDKLSEPKSVSPLEHSEAEEISTTPPVQQNQQEDKKCKKHKTRKREVAQETSLDDEPTLEYNHSDVELMENIKSRITGLRKPVDDADSYKYFLKQLDAIKTAASDFLTSDKRAEAILRLSPTDILDFVIPPENPRTEVDIADIGITLAEMVARYQSIKPNFNFIFTNLSYNWKVFIRCNRETLKEGLTQHDKKTLKRLVHKICAEPLLYY